MPVLDKLEISRADLLTDIAVGLCMDQRVTLGQAAEIAGLSQLDFRRLLGRLNVPIQYDMQDLHHDLAVLHSKGIGFGSQRGASWRRKLAQEDLSWRQ